MVYRVYSIVIMVINYFTASDIFIHVCVKDRILGRMILWIKKFELIEIYQL